MEIGRENRFFESKYVWARRGLECCIVVLLSSSATVVV